MDGQTCGFRTPRLVGLASPSVQEINRENSTTEKHPGFGIEPGFPDCEATVFPRRHCTPLICLNKESAKVNFQLSRSTVLLNSMSTQVVGESNRIPGVEKYLSHYEPTPYSHPLLPL